RRAGEVPQGCSDHGEADVVGTRVPRRTTALRTKGLVLVSLMVLSAGRPTAHARPLTPPPGVLVDIGSHSLHLRCIGPWTNKPIVVLEAGADGLASNWSAVQGLLASRVTTCAYDRA